MVKFSNTEWFDEEVNCIVDDVFFSCLLKWCRYLHHQDVIGGTSTPDSKASVGGTNPLHGDE